MRGPSSPEVTRAFCRVPSPSFSQAPWYALPAHLCRFRVRSCWRGCFLEVLRRTHNPISMHDYRPSSPPPGGGMLTPLPIDYAFRPRLRGRLTLSGLALLRNPWAFGESVSHTLYRYSCQHSHFRYLQGISRHPFAGLRNAPLPRVQARIRSFGVWLKPRYIFGAGRLRFRPVSYYAFFKGWLLLSQPPGCLGLPTSFPT